MSLIIKAAQYAKLCHEGQLRKGGEPYINHPLRVAGHVSMLPGAEECHVAAAWLHDVMEDCDVTGPMLYGQGFRGDVIGIVMSLTNQSRGMAAHGVPREERKRIDADYLARQPFWVRVIKLCDRIDNLRDARKLDYRFRDLYVKETRYLVTALLTPECDPGERDLLSRLHVSITCIIEDMQLKDAGKVLLAMDEQETNDRRAELRALEEGA